MKCLSCNNETHRPTDRLCPQCAAKFIGQISAANKKPLHEPERLEPKTEIPIIPPPISSPPPVYHSDSLIAEHQPTYSRTIEHPAPATSPTKKSPLKNTNLIAKMLNILVVSIMMMLFCALGYILGIYPYTEAKPFVEKINTNLPKSEKAHYEVIFQMQNIAELNLQELSNPEQISRLEYLIAKVGTRTTEETSPHIFLPILQPDQYVAGTQTGTEYAYNPEIANYSQQLNTTKNLYDQALVNHKELVTLSNLSTNMWVAQNILMNLDPLLESGGSLLHEVDALMQYSDFNLTLIKRFDDLSIALESAFLTNDISVIENTLRDVIIELERLQTVFRDIPKPANSEKVIENTNIVISLLMKFVTEFENSIVTDDFYRMVTAANQFFVDMAKYENKFHDDDQDFWQNLTLGNMFETWKDYKRDVLNKTQSVYSNPLFKIAEKI